MSSRDRPSSRSSARPLSAASQYSNTSASSAATNRTQEYAFSQRLGGLSSKQFDKLNGVLASAQKQQVPVTIRTSVAAGSRGEEDADETVMLEAPIRQRQSTLKAKGIRESHTEAPLQPRVVSTSVGRDEEYNSREKAKERASSRSSRAVTALAIPVDIQEAILVEDLLHALMGIEGEYIIYSGNYSPDDKSQRLNGADFTVHDGLSQPLCELTRQILPLAKFYTGVSAYANTQSELGQGLTNHALGAAIREQLDLYRILIAQLEHHFATSPDFTLKKLWLYVQEAIHTLGLIYALVQELTSEPAIQEQANDSDLLDSDSDLELSGPGAEGLKAVLGQMKAATSQKSTWKQGGRVKGGEVLAVIDEKLQNNRGDPLALKVYSNLLLKASQPYREMLLKWISTGQLDDPHDEFMIRETKSITRGSLQVDYVDEYWERRYTLKDMPLASSESPTVASNRPSQLSQSTNRQKARGDGRGGGAIIPAFLEEWKAKILLAGKYLNVIRECGLPVTVPAELITESKQSTPINDEGFYKFINTAYTNANQTLLRMLVDSEQLPQRLRSIKHYFFIDQGDFFTTFLDLAMHELSKKTKHISLSKLQTLLDLAIRNPSSASTNDPFKEDVKVGIMATTLADMLMRIVSVSGALPGPSPMSPEIDIPKRDEVSAKEKKEALTGIEAFTLEYTVTFPLSLVISRKTILKYQMIFRHLLQLRNLEHHLTNVWLEQTKSPTWRKRTPYPELERWKSRIAALRSRMLVYLNEMYDFAAHMVLEPNWRILEGQLAKANTVDQLLMDHADFLDTCLKSCMLTNDEMIQKLVHCINLFITYSSHFSKMASAAEIDLEIVNGDWSQIDTDNMERTIGKIESFFSHWVTMHAEKINYIATSDSVALVALYQRLAPLKRRPEMLPS